MFVSVCCMNSGDTAPNREGSMFFQVMILKKKPLKHQEKAHNLFRIALNISFRVKCPYKTNFNYYRSCHRPQGTSR